MSSEQEPLDEYLREPLQKFARAMEDRLRANDDRGIRSWVSASPFELAGCAIQQIGMLICQRQRGSSHLSYQRRAANAANYMMMFFDIT